MDRAVRVRFWFETAAAVIGTALLALTLLQREWIEIVFRVDVDRGSGALELGVSVALLLVSAGSAALARAEWRRTATT